MTNKQKQVISYLKTVESATLESIYTNIGFRYCQLWQHHLSELLSRMVKQGYIKRLSKGVFAFNSETPLLNKALDQNQLNLFK